MTSGLVMMIPRVYNGYGYTCGASKMGNVGMGMVCDFVTQCYTAPVPTVIQVFHGLIYQHQQVYLLELFSASTHSIFFFLATFKWSLKLR